MNFISNSNEQMGHGKIKIEGKKKLEFLPVVPLSHFISHGETPGLFNINTIQNPRHG